MVCTELGYSARPPNTLREKKIKNFSEKYHLRLNAHPNQLATDLLKSHCVKRLKRFNPSDLTNRFYSH
jgi:hypothetical protein